MNVLMYLRKSRADLEAEQRGEGETLARHRAALTELAKRRKLIVCAIYEEIVSGETIAARPQMQRLLSDVEEGKWDGVLVMEVERLARGDSIDQGIVAQAFKCSGTKIITPNKTYDPENEFDEEYFEFGLFMARREYKTIKRRMLAGMVASVKEGKYMGKKDPYGYVRVKVKAGKGYTLEPNPMQAEIVREMFACRLNGIGCQNIAKMLNARGEKTQTGATWSAQTVIKVLRNCVYAGYVTWGKNAEVRTTKNGKLHRQVKVMEEYIKVKGLHEPLVSESDFQRVQKLLNETPGIPIKKGFVLRNPFVGLLYCANCGHAMKTYSRTEESNRESWVHCSFMGCKNVGAYLHDAEEVLMQSLHMWLSEYDVDINKRDVRHTSSNIPEQIKAEIAMLESEKRKLQTQLDKAADLVEQGIYTLEYFVQRQSKLTASIKQVDATLSDASNRLAQIDTQRIAAEQMEPKLRHVIEAYPTTKTAAEKNDLLRTIITRINYKKEAKSRSTGDSSIKLEIIRKFTN